MISSNNNNKALLINKIGGPEVFSLESIEIPKPVDDQVLVKIDYVALNRADLLLSQGLFKPIKSFPIPSGMEGSGTIIGFASDEIKEKSKLNIGDKVALLCTFDVTKYGTFAQYSVFPYTSLIKHNSELVDQKTASAYWISFLTSYFAIVEYAKIKKGDYIVITAASSGVSLAAILISKYFGATVIATSRNSKKKQQILDYGADHFISFEDEDYVQRVNEITNGKGANIIYDSVGGSAFPKLIESAASFGKVIVYGLLDYKNPTVIPIHLSIPKHLVIKTYTLSEYIPQTELFHQGLQFLNNNLHQFKSLAGKEFIGIESLQESLRYLDSSDLFGKVVIKIN